MSFDNRCIVSISWTLARVWREILKFSICSTARPKPKKVMMEGESAITSLLSRGSFLFNIHSTASVLSGLQAHVPRVTDILTALQGSMQKLPMEDSKETLKREQMLEKCWGEIEKEMNVS